LSDETRGCRRAGAGELEAEVHTLGNGQPRGFITSLRAQGGQLLEAVTKAQAQHAVGFRSNSSTPLRGSGAESLRCECRTPRCHPWSATRFFHFDIETSFENPGEMRNIFAVIVG